MLVGLLNTLRVSAIGIVLATLIGTIVGIARLSRNWLVAKLASAYVETVRNIPLLLPLFFWYSATTGRLPAVAAAIEILPRSEERRVGEEWASRRRSRWAQCNKK